MPLPVPQVLLMGNARLGHCFEDQGRLGFHTFSRMPMKSLGLRRSSAARHYGESISTARSASG